MNRYILRVIGRLPQDWHTEANQAYLERLKPFAQLQIAELPEGHAGASKPDPAKTRKNEAESLLKGIPEAAWVVPLDETGTQYDSPTLAGRLVEWSAGGRTVVWLIGGSWGLDASVRERADVVWSLGKLTLPHALARIVLLEQLYRAALIQSGKTYHK